TEGRVIVTHDNDYLRFHAQGLPHPGMAYCPPQTRSIGHTTAMLRLMWELMTPDEMRNRVDFCKPLPLLTCTNDLRFSTAAGFLRSTRAGERLTETGCESLPGRSGGRW